MQQQKLVLWAVWGAILSFVLVVPLLFATGEVEESELEILHIALLAGPLAISVVLRWIILPKALSFGAMTPIFIAGLAIAESLVFLGLFVAPAFADLFTVVSILAVIQYIPLFIKNPEAVKTVYNLNE